MPLAHALAGDGGCESLLLFVDDVVPAVKGRTVPEPTFVKIAGFLNVPKKLRKKNLWKKKQNQHFHFDQKISYIF